MPISITIEGQDDWVLQTQIELLFNDLDAQFSTYKSTSDVAKFNRGSLPDSKQNQVFKDVLTACQYWNKKTLGSFDAFYGGEYDPSGYVKALAISRASELIEQAGHKTYNINASGDIFVQSDNDKVWNIGLQHPKHKQSFIGTISAKNLAVATSGTYERGNHIINPHTHSPAKELISLTVIGADIITADILATAACASEGNWQNILKSFPGYEALAILHDETAKTTDGFDALTSRTQTVH